MGQSRRHLETPPTAPAIDPPETAPRPVSRALMFLRGEFRALGQTTLDILRIPNHPPTSSGANDDFGDHIDDGGGLEFRAGPPHRHAAVIEIVRELARRAARTWYASLEQPQSVEDPA